MQRFVATCNVPQTIVQLKHSEFVFIANRKYLLVISEVIARVVTSDWKMSCFSSIAMPKEERMEWKVLVNAYKRNKIVFKVLQKKRIK